MSRHLYDLEKIMDTDYGKEALSDFVLYQTILEHRSRFNALKGIDYKNHRHELIKIVPPENIIMNWRADYIKMQESMIYGDTVDFGQLINRISALNTRVNEMNLQPKRKRLKTFKVSSKTQNHTNSYIAS